MKVALFTAGVLPVPPTKGGAVENLVQMLVEENEIHQSAEFTVLSIHDEIAVSASSVYRFSKFHFIKFPLVVKSADVIIYRIARLIFPSKALSFRMILSRLWYIKKSRDFFLQNDFHFIVAENHPSLFLVMKDRRMKRHYGGKFLYHAHNEPNGSFLCKKQIEQCPKVLTVSNFISNSWRKSYPDGQAEYVFVPNGIDIALFSQEVPPDDEDTLRKELGISEKDFTIIFAGRLVEGKGILQLARVFASLPIKEKRLLIVGSAFFGTGEKTPVQKKLEEILAPCQEKVVFTGYVPYQDIWKYYKISSVAGFVPIWNEACALTNIEAQASSLPVVTTTSGGIPEYSNPESQILLPIDEKLEQNLYNKLMWLQENPKICQEIGRRNFEFAQQFSKENFYKNFLHALESAHE